MTRPTYLALKKYILKDREKKKQEQEQDKEQERLKKEREMKRRKEEEDNLTLEETNKQILYFEEKLAGLKQEKSNLFSQLKKVLHQENDLRQRTQRREQTEQATLQHQYLSGLNVHPQVILQQQQQLQQRQKYLNIPAHNASPSRHPIKRSRSPSPAPPTYPFNSQFLPPNPVYNKPHEPLRLKPGNYPPPPPSQQQPPPNHPGLFLTQQQQQQQHNFLLQQQHQQQQQQNYSPSMNVQKYHPSIYFNQQQQHQQHQQQHQQQQLGYSSHQQQQQSLKQQQPTNYIKPPSNNQRKQSTPYGLPPQQPPHPDHPSKQMYSNEDKIKPNQVLSVGGAMLQVPGLKAGSIVAGHPLQHQQQLLQQQQLQQQQLQQQQQMQLNNSYNTPPSAAHNQSRPHGYPQPPQGRY